MTDRIPQDDADVIRGVPMDVWVRRVSDDGSDSPVVFDRLHLSNVHTEASLEALDALLNEHAVALAEQDAEIERLRQALVTIKQWDCLNPPRADLCHDHPWLRRHVDAALAAAQQPPGEEQT